MVTTDGIPGHRIAGILGAVVGVASYSSNSFRAGLRSVDDGGSISADERQAVMRNSREEAIELLAHQARSLGANAVVAMRFDHRQVTELWNEICAYGTAVLVVAQSGDVAYNSGGAVPWGN